MEESNPYALMTTTPYGTALANVAADLQVIFPDTQHVQQFLGALYLHFRRTPGLQSSTPESIKVAIMDMALSGLDIRNHGEAWLLPFQNTLKDERGNKTEKTQTECMLITGYMGRRKQALQHPAVIDAWTETVRKNDTFVYHGKGGLPEHAFDPFGPRGVIVGFYSVVELEGARYRCEVASLEEIKAHRDQYSRAAKSQFWAETLNGKENRTFELMAQKTILSRVCHPRIIPMTDAVRAQIAREEKVVHDATHHEQIAYLAADDWTEEALPSDSDVYGGDVPQRGTPSMVGQSAPTTHYGEITALRQELAVLATQYGVVARVRPYVARIFPEAGGETKQLTAQQLKTLIAHATDCQEQAFPTPAEEDALFPPPDAGAAQQSPQAELIAPASAATAQSERPH